ncbi:MAG: hypothetical protein ACI86P_002371 [Flavobacteriales bacterium]
MVYSTASQAQDSLLLMSGRNLPVKIHLIEVDALNFSFEDKKGKTVEGLFELDEIYSYKKEGGQETILYVQDVENGDIYTPNEHRFYIHGHQDARKGYDSKWVKIGGLVSGIGVTLYTGTSIIPFGYPLIYGGAMQLPFIKIQGKSISNSEFKTHESYRRGYEKAARSKKFVASFLSSLAGVIVGTAINEL